MGSIQNTGKLRVAVVTGRHPFDVPGFHAVFRSIPEIDPYIQHMEDFVSAPWDLRKEYEVVVFYNMHMETPGDERDWWDEGTKAALEQLGETKQGVFLLHHAILAFPKWPLWSKITGIGAPHFTYHMDQAVRYEIADGGHPITRGMTPWEMVDETYKMSGPGPDSHVLITADHPLSMQTIAWARTFRAARVFCYQSGHDNQIYVNSSFRTVVTRGILWCAGAI